MNHGTFAGRIGRDGELRATPNGKEVCNFSMGVSVGYGEKKETLWVDCAIWGERGKKLAQYLTKGTAITVNGDVSVRTYEGKDGTKAVLMLNVQGLTLQGAPVERVKGGKAPERNAPTPADLDDDLPFN